jgi:uncharacterized protein YjbI with pentapeptide repeats
VAWHSSAIDLRGADLRGVRIVPGGERGWVYMDGADLSGADLRGARIAAPTWSGPTSRMRG